MRTFVKPVTTAALLLANKHTARAEQDSGGRNLSYGEELEMWLQGEETYDQWLEQEN